MTEYTGWRSRVPILSHYIPMNHCSQAPLTDATRAAAGRFLDSWNQRGMDWDAWMEEVALAKVEFARLINAGPGEIAVFSSVSEAASAVASVFDWTGDRTDAVVSEAEFPGVGQVWLAQVRRGARVRWARLDNGRLPDPDRYRMLIDERTAIVSACHAYYLDGSIHDLAAIAREAHDRGALLFADAYQTAGAWPVDVKALGVDFLAAGCLKFLMGTAGIAFLYVRPELIEALHPSVTGWFGRVEPFAFQVRQLDWSPTASRFDGGTPPVINAYIARAGMEIINQIGPDAVRAAHRRLGTRLIEGGRARGLALHGPADSDRKTVSTAFVVPDSAAVETALRRCGVLASARGPVIRLAPHFYTTDREVDQALDALAEILRP
jgi:selenocysteine lyase/cysteine desulfurase